MSPFSFLEFPTIPEVSTELDGQLFKLRQATFPDILAKVAELKSTPVKIEEVLEILSEIRGKLRVLHAILPQNEFPDVFIWLYHNWKKVAYCRIPAADILYSDVPDVKGHSCDQTTSLTFKVTEVSYKIYFRWGQL